MARGVFILIGVLYFTFITPRSSAAARRTAYLSCTSSYSGDFVILDCYYNGGLPFPTLSWTGPGGLHVVKKNTQRLIVNITSERFVNHWDTIYTCKAKHWYSSSKCYVGRGIGSYVGIAFGVLGLLFLLCIFLVCMYKACQKLSEEFARQQAKNMNSPSNAFAGHNNPIYKHEPGQEGKTAE